MFTHDVEWATTQRSGDKSPLAHPSLGSDPVAGDDPADAGPMPSLRSSTTLRQLDDLGHSQPPPGWGWTTVRVESTGRIILPVGARDALGVGGEGAVAYATCNRVALVLRSKPPGAEFSVDSRGRVLLPTWLRSPADAAGSVVVVGTRIGVPAVVAAPASVLDGLGDLLTGDRR